MRPEAVDDARDLERIREHTRRQDAVQRASHERLLVVHALVVTVFERHTLAHVRQRRITIVDRNLSLLKGFAGIGRERLIVVERDAAELFCEPLEALEVDDSDVVDALINHALNRLHHERDAAEGEGGIDFVLTVTGDVDPRVAHDRHDLHTLAVGRDVRHQDGVGAVTEIVEQVLPGLARVSAEKQDIHGAARFSFCGHRAVGILGERRLHGLDTVERRVQTNEQSRNGDRENNHDAQQDPEDLADAAPTDGGVTVHGNNPDTGADAMRVTPLGEL